MRTISILLLAAVAFAPSCGPSGHTDDEPSPPTGDSLPRTLVIETGSLHIDAIYPSMTGPNSRVPVDWSDLDWVTGIKTEVIDRSTGAPMGDEFLCHTALQFTHLAQADRPIVTATGISEVYFPAGFAMPLSRLVKQYAGSSLDFVGMVLNNHEPDIDAQVNVPATIQYLHDADLESTGPIKPLMRAEIPITVKDIAEYTPENANPLDNPDNPDVTTHCVLATKGNISHWLVPPGRQKTRNRLDGSFLDSDVTVHYGVVHLHNYGVYMRLTDMTTGEILWQTDVVYEPDRKQIAQIPSYSSVEGFKLRLDHVYEIEALYDNTTDHDIDAMAAMSLYHNNGVQASFSKGPPG